MYIIGYIIAIGDAYIIYTHSCDYRADVRRWQQLLAGSNSFQAGHVNVRIVEGKPYPATMSEAYAYNALDVLCQHRAPLDIVMFDPGSRSSGEAEWFIIERVCKPRWVVLSNINLRSGGGWLYNRLLLLEDWQLVLRGHYSLFHRGFSGFSEMKRVRGWAVFFRSVAG